MRIALAILVTQLAVLASAEDSWLPKVKAMPVKTRNDTAAEWANILKNIKPKIDDPAAKPIDQPSVAGKSTQFVSPMVIGTAANAILGQFPWHMFIIVDMAFVCGGSLILEDWVMTSAHCIGQRHILSIGTVSITIATATIEPLRVFKHEAFNPTTSANNIGLMQLKSKLVLTANIKPIALPMASDAGNSFDGTAVVTSGFPRTNGAYQTNAPLMSTELYVLEVSECASIFANVDGSNMCTITGGTSDCLGDDGGPLVHQKNDGTFMQVGVFSYRGSDCRSWPAVYTRVTSYLGWISSKIGQDTTTPAALTTTTTASTTTTTTTTTTTSTTQPPTTTTTRPTTTTTRPTTTTTRPTTTTTRRTPTTRPTTRPTVKTTTTPKTKPTTTPPLPKCAGGVFNMLTTSNCSTGGLSPILKDKKNKKCGGIAQLKFFNAYVMNSQQAKIDNMIAYGSPATQKALAGDVCNALCFFESIGVIANGDFSVGLLIDFYVNSQTGPVVNIVPDVVISCIEIVAGMNIPVFTRGSDVCDALPYVVTQCVQFAFIMAGKSMRVSDAKCSTSFDLFDKCAPYVFPQITSQKKLAMASATETGPKAALKVVTLKTKKVAG